MELTSAARVLLYPLLSPPLFLCLPLCLSVSLSLTHPVLCLYLRPVPPLLAVCLEKTDATASAVWCYSPVLSDSPRIIRARNRRVDPSDAGSIRMRREVLQVCVCVCVCVCVYVCVFAKVGSCVVSGTVGWEQSGVCWWSCDATALQLPRQTLRGTYVALLLLLPPILLLILVVHSNVPAGTQGSPLHSLSAIDRTSCTSPPPTYPPVPFENVENPPFLWLHPSGVT